MAATTKYMAPRVETTVVDAWENPMYIEMRPIPANNPAALASSPPLAVTAIDASETMIDPSARRPAMRYVIAAAVLGSMDSDAPLPKSIQIPHDVIVIKPNRIPESISINSISDGFVSLFKEEPCSV
jgi:hypothetical protein